MSTIIGQGYAITKQWHLWENVHVKLTRYILLAEILTLAYWNYTH